MEKIITIKDEFNSLDTLNKYIKTVSSFESAKEYDNWDVRTNAHGQMQQCLGLKKSYKHDIMVYFENKNTLKMTYIIPSKTLHAYFGKSQKRYRNILEIIAGTIKDIILAPAQGKAFEDIKQVFLKISA
ncbi:hypothetical protein [Winogradskyella psychrotolerans]|uniref:hypothetical protein n=1 Tax=Winogradskyella psychrotolerans TaxID=1344585 RepID=UPI001C07C523|nr:hypothetical protein [Winogradskyella psychrotolerans]MBU2930251.1 hypothetical protein [Winogradskyella psychrotolerans]